MFDKNKLTPYLEYAKSVSITDSYLVLDVVEKTVEAYFKKTIYFDENYHMRFVENDKKISFSTDLIKLIVKNLKKEVVSYKKNNSFNKFSLIGDIINVKIIQYDKKKKKFLAVYKDLDLNCYIDTHGEDVFTLGQQVFVCVYQANRDFLFARINKKSALHSLQVNCSELIAINVEKYIPNRILVFKYLAQRKITREEFKKIKALFGVEKIVYIQEKGA